MTDNFTAESARIVTIVNGDIKLDTAAKPAMGIGVAPLVYTGGVSFPDFASKGHYTWTQDYITNDGPGGSPNHHYNCQSYCYLLPAEYGPAAAGGLYLPDIELGALPVGTDYLDVTVNLTRTRSPINLYSMPTLSATVPGVPWPVEIVLGENVPLDGKSVMIEHFGGMSRMFAVLLVDVGGVPHAMLRRKQSITSSSDGVGPAGVVTHIIDGQSAVNTGGVTCAIADSNTFESTYSGTITIVPCRHTAPV